MTSASDENYAGQYSCDDWVDNVERTPLKVTSNYFALKIEFIVHVPHFFLQFVCFTNCLSLETDTCHQLLAF